MGYRMVAVFLIASVCAGQTPSPLLPAGQALAAGKAPSTDAGQQAAITAPAGTTVALSLLSPIKTKTSRSGDSIRAVVAFPVTVGTELAIPAGTYVEGMITSITPGPPHGLGRNVKIHFTRLLFANGYSPVMDGVNTEARVVFPDGEEQGTVEIADVRGGAPFLGKGFAPFMGQTMPPPPPLQLPQVGPSKAVVIGASLGGMVGFTAIMMVVARHHANATDEVVYDNGWQFSMVLSQALTLDALRVKEAASLPAK
jgi:hypothetical protein